jgi:hypothetical protein
VLQVEWQVTKESPKYYKHDAKFWPWLFSMQFGYQVENMAHQALKPLVQLAMVTRKVSRHNDMYLTTKYKDPWITSQLGVVVIKKLPKYSKQVM